MRNGALLTGICMAALLTAPAPASAVQLVGARGQPVGGQWQRWADQAQVPTFNGPLRFTLSETLCNAGLPILVPGCSAGPPRYGPTYFLSIDPRCVGVACRDTLYSELGHLFDWRYLTNADRMILARMWRHARWPWWDTQIALSAGVGGSASENGLEADFTWAYQACAEGETGPLSVAPLTAAGIPASATPPALNLGSLAPTCRVIARAGRERHAAQPR